MLKVSSSAINKNLANSWINYNNTYDEDLEKYNIGPAGPLRDIDPARTQGILETLDFKDPSGELAFNYMDRLKSTEDGGFYETIQTNKPKFSEFQWQYF